MVVATDRMKRAAEEWSEKKEIREALKKGILRMQKRKEGRKES